MSSMKGVSLFAGADQATGFVLSRPSAPNVGTIPDPALPEGTPPTKHCPRQPACAASWVK